MYTHTNPHNLEYILAVIQKPKDCQLIYIKWLKPTKMKDV